MNAKEVAKELVYLIEENYVDDNNPLVSVRSFQEAGILTYNEGFVLKFEDGSKFQVTVVQSEEALPKY